MLAQDTVVAHLNRSLRTPNKRIACGGASVEMRESVSCGRGKRRSGREVFGDVQQAQVQNAWGESKVPQSTASPEAAKRRTPQRRDPFRAQRTIRPSEVTFRQIA